jgi:sec-independent protein translocase protein TatC
MSGAEEDKKMPLFEHLVELRTRLLYAAVGFFIAFIACFFVAQHILEFLQRPLAELLPAGRPMIFTDLTEPFFTQLKVAAFGALCLSFPIIASQVWAFIAPGLYKHEKSAFLPFLIATPIMFAVGMAFVYYILMPMAWKFFLGFETAGGEGKMAMELLPKIGEYINLIMKLIFAFGFCFELPVLLTLLAKVGIIGSQGLREKRRYAIVAIVIVAAIVTPPDAISMMSLAVPMLALYEISILMARLVEKKRAEEEARSSENEPGTDVKPA